MGSTNQFSTSFKNFMVSHVLAVSMNGIFFFPTILLNAVSIITILKSSELKSKPCYLIILVQSVIDLTVGVFGIPSFLVYLVQGITGTSNCFGIILHGKKIISCIDCCIYHHHICSDKGKIHCDPSSLRLQC